MGLLVVADRAWSTSHVDAAPQTEKGTVGASAIVSFAVLEDFLSFLVFKGSKQVNNSLSMLHLHYTIRD